MKNKDEIVEAYEKLRTKYEGKRVDGDNPKLKESFHRDGKKLLKILAEVLDIEDYALRSNRGGVAVSGEVTLHTPSLYVQLCPSFESRDRYQFLIRSVRSKVDFSGGRNHYHELSTGSGVSNPALLITLCERCQREYVA